MPRTLAPFSALALIFGASAGQVFADKADVSTKVGVTMVIPKTVATIAGNVLEIRLYKFDPRIADKGADLVEKIERKKFAHTTGTETKKRFAIGSKGKLEPRKRYYVTLFLLRDGKRTHIGEKDGKRGLCKVLTGGNPRKVTMIVRAIRR